MSVEVWPEVIERPHPSRRWPTGALAALALACAVLMLAAGPAWAQNTPSEPRNLTATASDTDGDQIDDQIVLSWNAPSTTFGLPISGYRIEVSTDSGLNWTVLVASQTATSYTHTGQAPDDDRYYRVAAINQDGRGPWSQTPRQPSAPQNLTATVSGTDQIDLSWDAPGSDNGRPVTGYRIDVSLRRFTWTTLVASQTATSYSHTGLAPGTSRHYRVAAINQTGAGSPSGAVSATTRLANDPPVFDAATVSLSVAENAAADQDLGEPVTAADPEGGQVAYSLGGADANSFTIDARTGQIRTRQGVAYDHETKPSYSVTVVATEVLGASATAQVTITVTDVVEPPSSPDAPTVAEVSESSTSLSVSWTAPANTGPAISGYDLRYRRGSNGSWLPGPQDSSASPATITGLAAGTSYEVQVRAGNAEGVSDWSTAGSGTTGGTAANTAPEFRRAPYVRTVAENATAGTVLWAPVAAADADGDTLTYTLAGGAGLFTVDSSTGYVQVAGTLDHETSPSHDLVVSADDGNGGEAQAAVQVVVTDVNEAPTVSGPAAVRWQAGDPLSLATYTPQDPDRPQQTLVWSLDAAEELFAIDQATGVLSLVRTPPSQGSTQRSSVVRLSAGDGSLSGEHEVTVTMVFADNEGRVSLSALTPVDAAVLTATLHDPDTPRNPSWQWQRSMNQTSGWTDIASGATSASYVPVPADVGYYLRAVVTYDDNFGDDQTATAVSQEVTAEGRTANAAPVLPSSLPAVTLPEDAAPGTAVGSPVTATDADGDTLSYSFRGASSHFVIDQATGQISVADGASLDYESQSSHTLTVEADDGHGRFDTATLTVTLSDANDAPDARNDQAFAQEDSSGAVIDVLVNDADPDQERSELSLQVATTPAHGTVTVNPAPTGGHQTLTYTPDPDYYGADFFVYEVSDGQSPALSDRAVVTVTVIEVKDPPTFDPPASQRQVYEYAVEGDPVGAPVAATDIDGDSLSYSLGGEHAELFTIDAPNGQLRAGPDPGFSEASAPTTYTVTVYANDTGGDRAGADVTITVTLVRPRGTPVEPPSTVEPPPTVQPPQTFIPTQTFVPTQTVQPLDSGGTTGGGFSDLDEAGVHASAVRALVGDGVVARTGCGSGRLCPQDPILRWEMAVWLIRVLDGDDPDPSGAPRFEDVTAGLWWSGHVERLAQLGITLGCSAEPLRYCPEEPVTRSQMASFLVRAFDLAAADPAGFTDTADNFHRVDIDALYASGVTLGCSAEPLRYCPQQSTTRGEMASFITRARALP